MYNLALLNTEQDIVHKMDFADIIDLFTAVKKQEKTVLSVFLRTCNFGFRFHQFLELKILLLSVQFEKKILLFNCCDFCIFKCHNEYKAKVSGRTGGP